MCRKVVHVLLLLVVIATVTTTTNTLPQHPTDVNNQCITGCPRSCSPGCLPNCCTGTGVVPASGNKPPMMITSVEEGETEEVEEGKGFGSPTDNSADPPGTITIPLPPTMYQPPLPGEEPKEMPLPEFKLPADILDGKMPGKSMTLSAEGTELAPGTQLPIEAAAAQPPPPTLTKVSLGTMSVPAAPAPAILPPVAVPAPPPAPVSTGVGLPFPKLPPVTVSEIPNRVNRQPPQVLPKTPVATSLRQSPLITTTLQKAPVAPVLSLPRPPPIHVAGDVALTGAPAAVVAPCGKSCNAPAPAPARVAAAVKVAAPVRAPVVPARAPVVPVRAPAAPVRAPVVGVVAPVKQQDMRYGVSYGRSTKTH